jgi:hypothetical protein
VHAAVSPNDVIEPVSRLLRSANATLPAGLRSAGLTRVAPLVPMRRRCQASSVPGVTRRCPRSPAGSSRASAARMARSAQSGLGRATWRRRTATLWRRARISASLAAWPRLSRYSQPKTPIMVRYRSRIGTVRDLASLRSARQTAGHGLCIEFWSGTGDVCLKAREDPTAQATGPSIKRSVSVTRPRFSATALRPFGAASFPQGFAGFQSVSRGRLAFS